MCTSIDVDVMTKEDASAVMAFNIKVRQAKIGFPIVCFGREVVSSPVSSQLPGNTILLGFKGETNGCW